MSFPWDAGSSDLGPLGKPSPRRGELLLRSYRGKSLQLSGSFDHPLHQVRSSIDVNTTAEDALFEIMTGSPVRATSRRRGSPARRGARTVV